MSDLRSLAAGVLLGVLLGFGTSLVFLVILGGPAFGIAIAVTGLRDGLDGRPLAIAAGGLLSGIGGVYLYGALNTIISCQGSEVCGGASALPFLGYGVVILALGVIVEVLAFGRGPLGRRRSTQPGS